MGNLIIAHLSTRELPDAAWQGTNCRDPSTQPHLPPVVRFSVGMTRGMGYRREVRLLGCPQGCRGMGRPQGLKPAFICTNRRHKCLLHPIIPGSKFSFNKLPK